MVVLVSIITYSLLLAVADGSRLKLLLLSPTAINIQWNCTQVKPFTLAWRGGLVKNALEQWQRTDMKVFDRCQNDSRIGQQVNIMINDLEEGMEYSLSVTEEFTSIFSFKTMTSGLYIAN